MIFASKTLPKYPPGHFDGDGCVFGDWQPHFTPRQHNEPNPILVEFRSNSWSDQWHADYWLSALDALSAYGGSVEWDDPRHAFHALTLATPEHIDHARKVLTRLAAPA